MTDFSDTLPSWHILRLDTVDSTNSYLRSMPAETLRQAPFCAVTARFQQAGRGQRGNSWESERDANLQFSIGVRPRFLPPVRQFALSHLISLAVRNTLIRYTDDIRIKWPNDIYAGDCKICGILIECDLTGSHIERACIGTGINLNQTQFRSTAPNPISLAQLTGHRFQPDEVLNQVLGHFETLYRELENGNGDAIRKQYLDSLYRRNELHPYRDAGGLFQARLYDVEADGHLLLQDADGRIRRYAFKEVQFVQPSDPSTR